MVIAIKAQERIKKILAGSAQRAKEFYALKERTNETTRAESSSVFNLGFEGVEALRATCIRGKRLYFVANEKSNESRTIFPTYLDGKRLNIVNPEFRQEYI